MREAPRDRQREVLAWVEKYAAQALAGARLPEFAAQVNRDVVGEVPEIAGDPALRRELEASTFDALRTYLSRAPYDQPGTVDPPPAARDLGRTLARRGQEVDVLLRVYRVGLRSVWRGIMSDVARADIDDELRAGVLDFLWGHLSRTVDHVVDELVAVHVDEVEQRIHGAAARKVETVHAILREEPLELEIASQRLSHNLHHTQTGLVLWATSETADQDPLPKLETLARELATSAGATRPLTVPSGPRTLWVWLATATAPDAIAFSEGSALGPGLRVAAGEPAVGFAGFRTSHREALLAQSVALSSPADPHVTRYRDVELLSLMSADTGSLRRFVWRELGRLAQPDSAAERLRETLLVYLEAGSSARAAEQLNVHKNTILYRLQQAEELLGHKADERRLHLEVALHVMATFGARVTSPPPD